MFYNEKINFTTPLLGKAAIYIAKQIVKIIGNKYKILYVNVSTYTLFNNIIQCVYFLIILLLYCIVVSLNYQIPTRSAISNNELVNILLKIVIKVVSYTYLILHTQISHILFNNVDM